MNFLDKMERKYGRYALKNLPMFIIATYVAGYVLELLTPEMLGYLTLEPYYILHGQVWRLVTWILIPPSSLDIFTIIMLFFYFSIGQTLERTWGSFKFDVYIFSGLIFTVIGAFLLYGMTGYIGIGMLFTTYYINMSIFLAFALTYPDMQVMLYFIIPIKMKWMGALYGVMILVSLVQGNLASRVAIIASLFNFIVFFLISGRFSRFTPHQIHRRQEFKRNVKKMQPKNGPKHKCAICGRTELDGDNLEFRFCSKCDGNYEYCQDHLFTHEHRRSK
ncbi:MAG: rhomboid family intramembrane serine protease [Lachnospiraceae bacterium]